MEPLALEHAEGGPLTLDLCHACDGIWFDAGEHLRLTAETTLALVTNMRDRHAAAARPGGARQPCPRCGLWLGPTYDLAGRTQYEYFRCPDRHGVFFRLVEFLRSQGIVRGLTDRELEELKTHAQTINCSNCGAPIALDQMSVCSHCGAPVSIVDVPHFAAALRDLEETAATERTDAERRQQVISRLEALAPEDQYKASRGGDLVRTGMDVVRAILSLVDDGTNL
jgi:hypothetical protein